MARERDGAPPDRAEAGDGGRRGIGAAEKAIDMLAALTQAGAAAPLRDLARAAGMPPSLAHRYLSSLIARGLARQDADTGFYDLGPLAIRMGAAALSRVDPLARATEAMAGLGDATGLTVLLTVLGERGPVIVRWRRSATPFLTSLAVGSTLPLTRSASGRAMLAFLPERIARDLIVRDAGDRRRDGEETARLSARLAAIRAQGYDMADSTVIPGLAALAAPVLDAQNEAVAALTLIGAVADVEAMRADAAASLTACCRSITRACGGEPGIA